MATWVVCDCGAVVADRDKHDAFHAAFPVPDPPGAPATDEAETPPTEGAPS